PDVFCGNATPGNRAGNSVARCRVGINSGVGGTPGWDVAFDFAGTGSRGTGRDRPLQTLLGSADSAPSLAPLRQCESGRPGGQGARASRGTDSAQVAVSISCDVSGKERAYLDAAFLFAQRDFELFGFDHRSGADRRPGLLRRASGSGRKAND